jgi:Holliday junction resolvasome RuvABC endonuclease subunit
MELFNGKTVVHIEGYSYGSKGQAIFQIAENCGILKYSLQEKKIGYDIIVPSIIKKFATDKGNANKELMYEQFCKDTKTDLMKTFDMQTLSNPITDIVDAYYIARCGYESTKGK